jgi:hypothetical protein
MLSKSKFIRGDNCKKSLWLYVHNFAVRKTSEATASLFSSGLNVGELAQQFFPGGVVAVEGDYPNHQSAVRTQNLIAQGVETIYEATFIYNDTLVAVDLLHKHNGKWSLYEVKSTNKVKPEHFKDVALQYYVVQNSGLKLNDAFLMHFDRDYVRRGAIVPKQLFKPESVLEQVLDLQTEVEEKIAEYKSMLDGEEPGVLMGNYCYNPYNCDFCDYCAQLPCNQRSEEEEDESPLLSNEPQVRTEEIRSFIQSIEYPICHLDFETIMPAVPMFDESRPYQQIPFQYSIHTQHHPDGEIIHTDYLAESNPNVDPRLGLITKMVNDTAGVKTVLVYNATFERSRIQEMIRDFPLYAIPLQCIIDKMKDLMFPFQKKYYTTEALGRKYSIKLVLPALCPEVSYSELEINNGLDASNQFLELYNCSDEKLIGETRYHLLNYCHLDTWAMVRILEVLKGV